MWTTIQIVFTVLGLLLVLGGDRLTIPLLTYAGLGLLGLAAMAIGWEGILTRRIVLGSRRTRSRSTYTGVAAVAQGVQFNLLGIFLFGIAAAMYLNNAQGIIQHFARRPGLPLLVLGGACLLQAVIALSGSKEHRKGPRWVVITNLLVSRLLIGIILVVIGWGATGLGLLEFVAPAAFDQIGGGSLEVLYGVR